MAELTCRLSPLVFGALYRLLATDVSAQDLLEDRLRGIELELDWLTAASDAYDEKWDDHRRQLDSGVRPEDLDRLDPSHAILASWTMAALRARGSSDDFNAGLRSKIFQRLESDGVDPISFSRREEHCPVVFGWTLGMVVSNDVDLNFPAVPAKPVKNEHIAAAYEGLVIHVAALRTAAEPWPDLLGTSTLVRGAGLAEALRPEAGSARAAIEALLRETARYVPLGVQTTLANHWVRSHLVEKRNAVVHITPTSGGGLAFLDAMHPADTWMKVRPTVQGVAQFIFQEVARELAEEPSEVRPGLWDQLEWDLKVWDA